jgi:cytochrome c biogenesis protein CcmG/thiol:disulfide interchange protein DsbE
MSDETVGSGPPEAGPSASPPAPRPEIERYRRRLRSLLVGCAAAVVLAVLLFVVLKPTARTATGQPAVAGPGSAAPDVHLPNLMSTAAAPLPSVDLAELGKDRHRPVVLNFYASWCTPCQEETPLFGSTAAAEAAKGSPVQFVGVDVADTSNGGATAVAFTRQAGVTYPVGADSTFGAAGAYGLFGLPDTVFINEEGVVVGRHLGALTAAELQAWLHKLAGSAG